MIRRQKLILLLNENQMDSSWLNKSFQGYFDGALNVWVQSKYEALVLIIILIAVHITTITIRDFCYAKSEHFKEAHCHLPEAG